jgi:hypothetical protein
MLIALPLLLILALPTSAFAELFTVTTNKDIYTPEEKAIIVGAIPEDAPDGYAVQIKVTGPRGDCAAEHVLAGADNGFRSRPISLDECGFGEFTVSAYYADLETNSTFTISNSSQTEEGSKLELRMLKNVILKAQDVINTRVKELIEDGYVLPEEVANKYGEGVSEASLALQAIEFGDAAEAKGHMIFALRDFREVRNALLEENVARFEQTDEQKAANDGSSDIIGTYNILQRKYYKLQNVAEKNQVDKESQFKAAALLLENARQMIDDDNLEGAVRNLNRANTILEEIRADLYDRGKEEGNLTSYANTTSPEDEDEARRLTETAAKYEKDALELLNEASSNPDAEAKVREALSLIANATASIGAQDFDSARDTLRAAYNAILDAQDLIEDDEGDKDGDASTSNSGENSDDDSGGSSNDDSEDPNNTNSGSDKDEGDKGSNDTEDSDQ